MIFTMILIGERIMYSERSERDSIESSIVFGTASKHLFECHIVLYICLSNQIMRS